MDCLRTEVMVVTAERRWRNVVWLSISNKHQTPNFGPTRSNNAFISTDFEKPIHWPGNSDKR